MCISFAFLELISPPKLLPWGWNAHGSSGVLLHAGLQSWCTWWNREKAESNFLATLTENKTFFFWLHKCSFTLLSESLSMKRFSVITCVWLITVHLSPAGGKEAGSLISFQPVFPAQAACVQLKHMKNPSRIVSMKWLTITHSRLFITRPEFPLFLALPSDCGFWCAPPECLILCWAGQLAGSDFWWSNRYHTASQYHCWALVRCSGCCNK